MDKYYIVACQGGYTSGNAKAFTIKELRGRTSTQSFSEALRATLDARESGSHDLYMHPTVPDVWVLEYSGAK